MNSMVDRAARNLALLLFGVLPITLVLSWLVWLQSLPISASGGAGNDSAMGKLGLFANAYAYSVGPVMFGGLLHQLVLLVLARNTTKRTSRFALLLSAPVILILYARNFGVAPDDGGPELSTIVAMLAGALVYGLLARPLDYEAPRT